MFSRLYLGVHSPADIVAGGIIGCVILAYWIKIDTIVDRSISFGDNGMYCCSTDSLIVHFRGMNGTSVPFTISIQCQSGIQTVWKTFYTCANLPTYLELLSVSTAWGNKGYCFSPFPPPSWWNAGQASLALIVQIESHTTVRGKFLEQVGTTEALPGSWTWTCQFRV